jgi:hypothetical protein
MGHGIRHDLLQLLLLTLVMELALLKMTKRMMTFDGQHHETTKFAVLSYMYDCGSHDYSMMVTILRRRRRPPEEPMLMVVMMIMMSCGVQVM